MVCSLATVAKRLYIPRGSRYNVDKQILLTLTPEQLAKSCEILDLLANDETPNDGTCGINYVSFFILYSYFVDTICDISRPIEYQSVYR